PLTVVVPGGNPTGQVFNADSSQFIVCSGACGSARFIFATERGVISGWNPGVNLTGAVPSTHAVAAVAVPGANYKGLALATSAGSPYLYAANFHAGTVDVFDTAFHKQTWDGAFVDPALPAGYAPFNVALIRGMLYVTYAVTDPLRKDDVPGAGNGIVDVFTTDGGLVRRLITRRGLNSPWGMAHANTSFGKFSGALLVGNFGDGLIHAYDPRNGSYRGVLTDAAGAKVKVDGLWGLLFGNGVSASQNSLMYTAGPSDEAHGRFGIIRANL
ncbi:MAG: TIGR03118 family protein, partial [Mycobacteriales bacterium]